MSTEKPDKSPTRTKDSEHARPGAPPGPVPHEEPVIDISTADDVDIDEGNTDEDEETGSQPVKGS